MHIESELVPVGLTGQMVEQIRVVDWQSSYAFYLQGFSYAHIEAYQRHIQKAQQHEHW